nr:glycoside hydrolase family protein [uncultured Comamonas sp.]
MAALTLSAAALVGIVLHEGYTDRAVIPVKGDVPTIGFGTTTGVKLGDTTTPPKALARALTDVQQFEGALKQCVTVPLAQHEYDALVSFSYNVGGRAFCQSTLVRKLSRLEMRVVSSRAALSVKVTTSSDSGATPWWQRRLAPEQAVQDLSRHDLRRRLDPRRHRRSPNRPR